MVYSVADAAQLLDTLKAHPLTIADSHDSTRVAAGEQPSVCAGPHRRAFFTPLTDGRVRRDRAHRVQYHIEFAIPEGQLD